MVPALDRLILNMPRLFIKQYPYAWFPLVATWGKSVNFTVFLVSIIMSGILLLRWQSAAWVSQVRRERAGRDGKFYVDAPAVPRARAVKNLIILLGVSGLVAYLLRDQVTLGFWQIFFISAGFTLTYQDVRFFGAQVIYIVTAPGIAVYFAPGHLDYRLFFTFKEIARIERTQFKKDEGWDYFARTREAGADGLLLIPKDINGFSKRMKKLFIVPRDVDSFLEQLPYGYR